MLYEYEYDSVAFVVQNSSLCHLPNSLSVLNYDVFLSKQNINVYHIIYIMYICYKLFCNLVCGVLHFVFVSLICHISHALFIIFGENTLMWREGISIRLYNNIWLHFGYSLMGKATITYGTHNIMFSSHVYSHTDIG